MSRDTTFIDMTEAMIDDLSAAVEDYIDTIIDSLMPDGRPFGMEPGDINKELVEYMQLRNNAAAWWDWMAIRVEHLTTRASQVLSEEQLAKHHMWDIVARFAINYSAKMERELKRRTEKAGGPFEVEVTLKR